MNLVELDHALRKLRLSGMAAVLETRLRHAQTERLTPIDLVSMLVSDELLRRQDRLLERRHKQAGFRDPHPSLDTFDFDFNKKMNRALIHDLATGRSIAQREDALFLGPPGTGKSHLAQAIGRAVIQQGYRVLAITHGNQLRRDPDVSAIRIIFVTTSRIAHVRCPGHQSVQPRVAATVRSVARPATRTPAANQARRRSSA
jgi:DNA replication protein DnaC